MLARDFMPSRSTPRGVDQLPTPVPLPVISNPSNPPLANKEAATKDGLSQREIFVLGLLDQLLCACGKSIPNLCRVKRTSIHG